MKRLITLSLILLFSCSPKPQEIEIKAASLMKDIKALSDDAMMGRAPATEGDRKAVAYITEQFKNAGLKPINGSYTQDVTLIEYKKVIDKSSLSIKSKKGNFPIKTNGVDGSNITFWSSSLKDKVEFKDADLVFAGYGVEAAEHDWDDFKGSDLKGKILVLLNNDPQVMNADGTHDSSMFKGETRTYYGRWTYKFEQAKKHGAIGAIIVHTTQSAGYGYHILGDAGLHSNYAVDLEGAGFQLDFMAHMDSTLSDQMARNIGKTLPELFEMALSKDFKPMPLGLTLKATIQTEIKKVKTSNVFAVVEGTDAKLKDQYLVFSAHYDHKGQDSEGEDHIYNGAWDNASGTSSIINLAKAFVKNPQKRSLLFLACGAEESGSLGSNYFASNPPIPANQIVGNLNIDMPSIFGVSYDFNVVGVNSNSMGDQLKELAKNVMIDDKSLMVQDDPNPNAGLFYRSDQVNFAKKGIPALFFMSGTKFVGKDDTFITEMEEKMYHTKADEVNDLWDLSGLERDLKLIYRLTEKLANDPNQPTWHKGNEFESRYNALYK